MAIPLLCILIGIIGRLIIHIPDVTPLTSLCLFSTTFFSKRQAVFILVIILILSDTCLHFLLHYPVFGSWTLFTYSGWIGTIFFGCLFAKKTVLHRALFLTFYAAIIFWIWTNFGTWCLAAIYPHTPQGLLACYIAAIPFLKNSIMGALVWTFVLIILFYLAPRITKHYLYIFFVIGTLFYCDIGLPQIAATDTSMKDKAYHLENASGLLKFDYQFIPIPGYQRIDLMGLHYLHQINGWLYFGVGSYAPMFHGNYGGFFTLDTTIQVQHQLLGNVFGDVGSAFGGGGGGSTATESKKMCGDGRYITAYAGLGYHFPDFSVGANYSYFYFFHSPINHYQVDFYIQKSLPYFIGSYKYIGKFFRSTLQTRCDKHCTDVAKNKLTFELNNFLQHKAKGQYKGNINTIAFQFSHYIHHRYFVFFEGDAGYHGLPAYNQVVGGIGYHFLLFPDINFSSQLGVGSGGYDPYQVNTGSGMLIYPKFSLEYLFNQQYSVALTGGYLFAPTGNFNSFSLGLALNYYLQTKGMSIHSCCHFHPGLFKGFRVNLFNQTEFDAKFDNQRVTNLNLISVAFDSFLHTYWFIPTQLSFAYNDIQGYPGYGEALVGLGVQNKYVPKNKLQYFFQGMIGTGVQGMILKPEIGINYGLSDHLAIYSMLAKTISLDAQKINSYSVGLGLTYRFSLLEKHPNSCFH